LGESMVYIAPTRTNIKRYRISLSVLI